MADSAGDSEAEATAVASIDQEEVIPGPEVGQVEAAPVPNADQGETATEPKPPEEVDQADAIPLSSADQLVAAVPEPEGASDPEPSSVPSIEVTSSSAPSVEIIAPPPPPLLKPETAPVSSPSTSKPEEIFQYTLLLVWDIFRSMIRLGSKVTLIAVNDKLPPNIGKTLSYFTGLIFAILVTVLGLNIISYILVTFFKFLLYPSLVVLLAILLINLYQGCGSSDGFLGFGEGRCSTRS
jgi:hypothetical protein